MVDIDVHETQLKALAERFGWRWVTLPSTSLDPVTIARYIVAVRAERRKPSG